MIGGKQFVSSESSLPDVTTLHASSWVTCANLGSSVCNMQWILACDL